MRTTLNLNDELMRLVKQRAVAEGRTVTSLVEEGLRAMLDRYEPAARRPIGLTVFWGAGGTHPGVDIDDSRALNDLMDEEEYDRIRSGQVAEGPVV